MSALIIVGSTIGGAVLGGFAGMATVTGADDLGLEATYQPLRRRHRRARPSRPRGVGSRRRRRLTVTLELAAFALAGALAGAGLTYAVLRLRRGTPGRRITGPIYGP
jgi:hypothetical protein